MASIHLPIRQLVEFLLRTGSIDSRFTGFDAPTRAHASTASCKRPPGRAIRPRYSSARSGKPAASPLRWKAGQTAFSPMKTAL